MEQTVTHGRTAEIRKAITALLKLYTNNVYYQRAKSTADSYAVFLLGSIFSGETTDQCSLDINIVDRGQNSVAVDDLTDTIFAALDHYYYNTNGLIFTIYPETKNPVREEDDTIIRRRISATLRIYGG